MNAQTMKSPHPDEAVWKARYEALKQFMADAEHEIRDEKISAPDSRAWDPPEEIFVSFAFDVCSDREHALKHFGANNFDVYQLKIRSPKE